MANKDKPLGDNNVLRAAAETSKYLTDLGWQHCFIGGVAYLRYGEPRQTVDIDGVLLTGFGGEQKYVETLLETYASTTRFHLQHRTELSYLRTSVALASIYPWEGCRSKSV